MIQDSFDPIYYYPVNQIRYKNSSDSQYVTFKYKEVLDSVCFFLIFVVSIRVKMFEINFKGRIRAMQSTI